MSGDRGDDHLAGVEADGLRLGGWQSQVTLAEPDPLPAGRRCCSKLLGASGLVSVVWPAGERLLR